MERERDGEEGGEVVLARSGGEARNEAKQLFHRKAGIESQSPVVTLMRASVRAPEGRWQQRPGSAHPIFFWKWKWKRCMCVCMQCDSVLGWVGQRERWLYT